MSVLPILPQGFVVGRILTSRGDSADADKKADTAVVVGMVDFTPATPYRKLDAATVVTHSKMTAKLDSHGDLHPQRETSDNTGSDAEDGIWLPTGTWKVTYRLNAGMGALPEHQIEVTTAHTDAAPLPLFANLGDPAPAGATFVQLSVPLGGQQGQVLVMIDGSLAWGDVSGGGVGLDTEAVQDIVGAMVAAAGGTYNDAAGTITLPSGGSVDIGIPVPNGSASHYYAPGWQFGNTWGTYSLVYQSWRFVPWWLDSTRTLVAFGVNLSTAVTGAKMRIGVYNADTDWQPTTLVYQTAELDASASGLLAVTGLTSSMPAGRYVVGLQSTQNTGNLNLRCPTQAGFLHSSAGGGILGATYMEWKVNAAHGPFNDPATVKWNSADQGSNPCVFGRFQ